MADSDARSDNLARSRGSLASATATRRCGTCGATYPGDFLVCPKDATSLEARDGASEDPLIGEVLAGSFLITGVLGVGGMGRVYAAEHVRLPKRFAVKVMHEELAGHGQSSARFEREAQAAARIANEHVLEVVDVVRAQGRGCIVTELLEGEELGDILDRMGKLPLTVAVAIARQVCNGLAAAHAVGVVHRDLKPSNLFLVKREGSALHVKILDFGIAKVADGARLTQTGAVLGTPSYMAPEQALGSGKVDARADIYGVGAVLYRILTGVAPFPEDGDPATVLTQVLTEDPRRPRDLDRTIPAGVEALIQRTMARSPEARPASMQELDRLLAPFDAGTADALSAARASLMQQSRASSAAAGLALGDTVAVMTPPEAARDAAAVTRAARRTRPAAMLFTVLVSLTSGAAVLLVTTLALRSATNQSKPSETEGILIAVLALLATMFALLGAMRVLISRWRSALAIERLGEGLRAALLWFFVPLGIINAAWIECATFGLAPPAALAGWVNLGIVLAPTLLGAGATARALKRAGRV
jgi:eukaryotic-like serine/threonine-protein kinase